MLKSVFAFHIFPVLIALGITAAIVHFIPSQSIEDQITIDGTQKKTRGVYSNLSPGNQAEIDFISSIKSEEQITILGSSEFSSSPFCPYYFLPDSIGIPALGVGHGYHQSLSILNELLAADEYIEGSKINIIVSFDWFKKNGTNTPAFLEFAQPNFLKSILHNPNIDLIYKQHIGKFVNDHSHEMNGLTFELEEFRNIYLKNSSSLSNQMKYDFWQFVTKVNATNKVNYKPQLLSVPTEGYVWQGNTSSLSKKLQHRFLSSVTTNSLFVYDDYYTKYLVKKNGDERKGKIKKIDLNGNHELADFKLLVKYLKDKKANCSFIIQPMNPHYYADLENYTPLVDSITTLLNEANIPYLNMHVTSKEDYEPGTLKDIMHLGDFGWMKVNEFLINLYDEKKNS